MMIFTLVLKAVFAGAVVLGLSLTAERLSPRIAGIISGAPLGALISYYLLGLEKGVDFVAASVPHAIVGIAGVLMFVVTYHAVSIRAKKRGALKSTSAGLLAFMVIAFIVREFEFTILTALPVTAGVALLAGILFRRAEDLRVVKPVKLTFWLLVLRAGMSAILVVSVVTFAKILGPVWAGVLMGFPMIWLPTILIIELTYSREHAHAMFRGFPIGIGSVVTYLASVPWSFSTLGVHVGTIVSLGLALIYLASVTMIFTLLKHRA